MRSQRPDESWITDLAQGLSRELGSLRATLRNAEIAAFAIDCHPWNGTLALAMLTTEELREDPELDAASEMAAWQHYDFAADAEDLRRLGEAMKAAYAAATMTSAGAATAEQFFMACARAIDTVAVRTALDAFARRPSLRIYVVHPDDERSFYPPATSA